MPRESATETVTDDRVPITLDEATFGKTHCRIAPKPGSARKLLIDSSDATLACASFHFDLPS
jgi:hypothetical protein